MVMSPVSREHALAIAGRDLCVDRQRASALHNVTICLRECTKTAVFSLRCAPARRLARQDL
ncbi:hypothetical protein [Mizugakiibacter sediminis]|uniref:hypothetical protein n=1 Tax=Mizugakiibacter sediminis TaxID=1475481 RepID=UPI0016512B72|nr:hypothetical protein [Mizugakiibacter sediminis]